MSETPENFVFKKLSPATHLLYLASIIVPIAFAWVWSVHMDLFSVEDTFRIFFHPAAVVLTLATIGTSSCIYFFSLKRINSYDGSPDSILKTRRTVVLLETYTLVFTFVNSFIIPFVVEAGAYFQDIYVPFFPLLMDVLGSCFLFSNFFYIAFLHILEKQLTSLPLLKKDIKMSLTFRSTMIALLGGIGLFFIILAPILAFKDAEIAYEDLILGFILPGGLIGIVCIAFDVYITMYGNTRQVRAISKFTDSLAAKDYTYPTLQVNTRDEYGTLINDLNTFYTVTTDLLKKISHSVGSAATNSDKFANDMKISTDYITQIMVSIDNIKNKIQDQAKGVDISRTTINQMLERIDSLDCAIDGQVYTVTQSSAAVEEMVANIKSVTDILESNSQAVNDLGKQSESGREKINASVEYASSIMEKSESLKEASNIISTIAEQTNLLAMNAAIEAAHAGESGKGFAVVADEIRKLAEQSSQQGAHITEELDSFQAAISGVAENTNKIQQEFEQIYNLTNLVRDKELVIKNAMEEQNAGSVEVLAAMNEIKESSIAIKQESVSLTEEGKQVGSEIQTLANLSNEIGVEMAEIAANAEQITESTTAVTEGSIQNKDNMISIQKEVSQFKL